MTRRYFGTDGVRGVIGESLTLELVERLGRAVALLSEDVGAVISASHNPPDYNGVKLFHAGRKLTDEQESEIEALIDVPGSGPGGGERERRAGAAASYR